MKLKLTLLAAALGLAAMQPASAAITLTVTPGTNPYSGPTPTYTFDTPTPVTGGYISNTSVGSTRAQPFGSTGNYWAVGPSAGLPGDASNLSTGVLDLSSFGVLYSLSFIWGSVDSYNTLEFLDGLGNVVAGGTFTGSNVFNPANGNQSDPNTNPLVQFLFTGADQTLVKGVRLRSSTNAFEIDNVAVNAVPEPGTWALMLLGFAGLGLSLRRKRTAATLPALA